MGGAFYQQANLKNSRSLFAGNLEGEISEAMFNQGRSINVLLHVGTLPPFPVKPNG